MSSASRIALTEDIPEETTFLFRVRPAEQTGTGEQTENDEQREAILVRSDDDIVGWLNYCQHYTHIKLDKGSGAEMRDGEVICTNHGAYFETDSGQCTFGPCEGAYLTPIEIRVDGDTVYLVDEKYEFVGTGAIETDSADLGSKSNYKF